MAQRTLAQRLFYAALRLFCRWVGIFYFRIRCFGRENYPQHGPALVCANHQSHLDPVLVGLTCDRRLNYVARKSLFTFAPFRWLIEFLDAIPIDREGFSLSGIRETLKRLRNNELVLIFPEGTRSPDGELKTLKPGICALARRGRVPLIPVGFDGAFDSWPKARSFPARTDIHIVIGRPISAEKIASLDDEQLLAELEGRITECFQQARRSRRQIR